MTKTLDLPQDALRAHLCHGLTEDFREYTSGDRYTTVAPDSGTAAVIDGAGGVLQIRPSDGSVADNDETYIVGKVETYLFAANRPIYVAGRIKLTEANGDDANAIFGLMDNPGANALLDNGAGPAASYSGMVFFKVDGSTVWQAETSIAGTQTTTTLNASGSLDRIAKTAGGGVWQFLEIEWNPIDATYGSALFKIDGTPVAYHERWSYASATEMKIVCGVKNGDTNNEDLLVDLILEYQQR